jgi:hypothetical protein
MHQVNMKVGPIIAKMMMVSENVMSFGAATVEAVMLGL